MSANSLYKALATASLGACLALPGLGCAAEQTASTIPADRFAQMDVNNDGKVVIEEFRASFPNMNEQAFAIIDKNGDQGIDRAEWFDFMENHGKPQPKPKGAPLNNIPGDPLIPPPDSADLPLVRPPMGQ